MQNDEPYWQDLVPVSTLQLASFRDPQPVFFRVHQSAEEYDDFLAREFEMQLSQPEGTRQYLHTQAVVFTPRIILNVAITPTEFNQDREPGTPHPASPIGFVLGAQTEGQDQIVIGNAQAWFYPCDNVLVLWEVELFHLYDTLSKRDKGAPSDVREALWRDFEGLLRTRFPQAERILTPAWEPGIEHGQWQEFLRKLGFEPAPELERAFGKRLG